MSDYNNDRLIELTNDNERLRMELAEAKGLLLEAKSPLDAHFTRACRGLLARIDAFLAKHEVPR